MVVVRSDAAADRAFLRDAPVTDAGFGLVTRLRLPGGGELQLYQPSHATAYDK